MVLRLILLSMLLRTQDQYCIFNHMYQVKFDSGPDARPPMSLYLYPEGDASITDADSSCYHPTVLVVLFVALFLCNRLPSYTRSTCLEEHLEYKLALFDRSDTNFHFGGSP